VPGRRGDLRPTSGGGKERPLRDPGGYGYYLDTPVGRQDIIITNPPYSLALPFLQKSLSEADTVVYLLRLNFLGSAARKPFWDAYPPTHLFTITPRPRFVNGGSDACEYGWFLWDRGERVLTPRSFVVL
jgi:hypothetical protein